MGSIGDPVPVEKLIPGDNYWIFYQGRQWRVQPLEFVRPNQTSPRYSHFRNPDGSVTMFSPTFTFHEVKSIEDQYLLQSMYRQKFGGLPAELIAEIGTYGKASDPSQIYKHATTGTGTGVSLPRGGKLRKTRKSKHKKNKRKSSRRVIL